ncbi:hypothetical protein PX699_15235 [Sphingobium sp. H39-3-25]|uniref:hypothetical protein n=1 Tax=Sphingobium arseniciresistens TaxID=3030834 RepID=UPI0023BA1747|nr:hypothetical protein [Sphingobium arseniciresistens]
MSGSLPPRCAQNPEPSWSVRQGPLDDAALRAAGAAVTAPCAAAPPPVSTAASLLAGPASTPLTVAPVAAVLTTFQGQAVYRILSPGSPSFRAGDLLRFAYGSRTARERPL